MCTDLSDKENITRAKLLRIGFYFNGEYRARIMKWTTASRCYAAFLFGGRSVKAYMFWYVLRDYPDANILFDCDYENCYYEWLKDFPYADCPARILGKLTPTGNITANNWRAARWRNAARRKLNGKDTV